MRDVAVVTEEAIRGGDTRELIGLGILATPMVRPSVHPAHASTAVGWSAIQPPPQLTAVIGNVTFLERPFHPTTLVSVVQTAIARPATPI